MAMRSVSETVRSVTEAVRSVSENVRSVTGVMTSGVVIGVRSAMMAIGVTVRLNTVSAEGVVVVLVTLVSTVMGVLAVSVTSVVCVVSETVRSVTGMMAMGLVVVTPSGGDSNES